jgi:YNFM family putative membrane transporter
MTTSARPDARAVAAIAFAAVATFADMYITQPLLPEFSRDFGVSPTLAAGTISAVVLAIALTSNAYGPLGDVLGRKRVMVWGCLALGAATLACAFAPGFGTLLVLRALQGALVPAVSAVAVAYLGDLRSGVDPGAIVGVYIGATVTGGLVGRVASAAIAEAWSWRAPFLVFAVVTMLAALAMGISLSSVRPNHGRLGPQLAGAYRSMAGHLANPRLLGAFIVAATLFFGFIGIFTYLSYLLTARPFSLSTGAVGWFYLPYLAGTFTAPIAGRLSARISRRALMACGFALAACGTLITLAPSLVAIVGGTVVLTIGMFTAQAVAPAYVNVTAVDAKGGANALYQTFYYVGAVFGSTLPGLAWETYGWPGVVATCCASFAIGFLAVVLLCRPLPRRLAAQ